MSIKKVTPIITWAAIVNLLYHNIFFSSLYVIKFVEIWMCDNVSAHFLSKCYAH